MKRMWSESWLDREVLCGVGESLGVKMSSRVSWGNNVNESG